jgi:K+ transporter
MFLDIIHRLVFIQKIVLFIFQTKGCVFKYKQGGVLDKTGRWVMLSNIVFILMTLWVNEPACLRDERCNQDTACSKLYAQLNVRGFRSLFIFKMYLYSSWTNNFTEKF